MEHEQIKTWEFDIPINHIAPTKKAAKEMGLDIIVSSENKKLAGYVWRTVTMIGTLTSIFSLGYLTGMNVYDNLAANPLREAMDILQNKINVFVKENPDAQKIIDDIDKKQNNENGTENI